MNKLGLEEMSACQAKKNNNHYMNICQISYFGDMQKQVADLKHH